MKSNKLRILTLAIATVLVQGTYVYASSSTDKKDYTKEELENLTPGWEKEDIKKNNYKTNYYKNAATDPQSEDEDEDDDNEDDNNETDTTTTTTGGTDINTGEAIVSTTPSTGNKGDFWGKTQSGKWMLIQQGSPATGWQSVRGKWYYMDQSGIMQTGWINDGQTWYYLYPDGSMAYNTYVDGYYLDWNGAMQ